MRVALFVQVPVDREQLRVVVAHRQAGRVAARCVPVLRTSVQLVLLLVKAVHEIARAAALTATRRVLQHVVERSDRPAGVRGRWNHNIAILIPDCARAAKQVG